MLKFVNEHSASVNVTVHQNHLQGDGTYLKVQRNTLDMSNVIAKVLNGRNNSDEGALLSSYAQFKGAILQLLRDGYAVNVLDLGILRLCASHGKDGGSPVFSLAFTPSAEALQAVAEIEVSASLSEKNAPSVSDVYDIMSDSHGGVLSAGGVVQLTGQRLKVAGGMDVAGVFFAPVTEDGYTRDEAAWVKIGAEGLRRNMPGTLLFCLPKELSAGNRYALIIRTAAGKGKTVNKTAQTYVHPDFVTIA